MNEEQEREREDPGVLRPAELRHADGAQRAQIDLQEAQQALRAANTRMENMLESLTDGFCAVDLDWRITYINARALELLSAAGTVGADLSGQVIWQQFPALAGSAMEANCRRALAVQQTVSFEFFYPERRRWYDLRAYPSPEGLTTYFQDITQRKLGEQSVLDVNKRLQVALSAGRLGDWRWDAATDRVTLGARAAEIFALAPETPHEWESLRERLYVPDQLGVRQQFMAAFGQGTDLNIECRIERASGEPRWVAVVGRIDYDRAGAVVGMTGVIQDISTRKSVEDTLRESEEVLRALANSIPQLAWMAQADGAIVWFNKLWYEYTGTTTGPGGRLGLANHPGPGSTAADAAALARFDPHRHAVRDGISDSRRGRPVPLVPDPGQSGARPAWPRGALVRHEYRR